MSIEDISRDDDSTDAEASDENSVTEIGDGYGPGGVPTRVDITDPFNDSAQVNRGNGTSGVLYFAGVDPREAAEGVDLPNWWSRRIDRQPETSLREAITVLPRAGETEVFWRNPATGELHKTEKHNALYNPAMVEDVEERAVVSAVAKGREITHEQARDLVNEVGVREARENLITDDEANDVDEAVVERMRTSAADNALWNVPTDDYTVINPTTFLEPLVDAINDSDLGGVVFGEFELSRGGGRVKGDIYFDATQIDLVNLDGDGENTEPIMLGIEVGWDFFGGSSAYAQGIAMQTGCLNSLRHLTDKISVRHRGRVSERINFWNDLLDRIGLVADDLAMMIHDASNETVDFSDLPMSMQEFFEFLGFPDYLTNHAADYARQVADEPFEPTLWDLHNGATYAVTHYARGSAGSVDRLNRSANDLIFNPAEAVDMVHDNYVAAQQSDDGDGEQNQNQITFVGGGGQASVQRLRDSLREKREQYENQQEQIRERFETVGADE